MIELSVIVCQEFSAGFGRVKNSAAGMFKTNDSERYADKEPHIL